MFGVLADKIEAKCIPVTGSFELTWKCNLHCRFCYQCQGSSIELALDEIEGALKELAGLGCLFLSLTGGECLLREDFWDIAEFAKDKQFAVTLQTNGTLITNKEIAKRIKELNFFDVHISLLGAIAKTHDWFTQTVGSFDKTIKAIELLRMQDIQVMLNTTVMKQNFSELKDIGKIARRYKCQQVVTPIVSAKNNGDKRPCDFRIDDSQIREFYSAVFRKTPRRKEAYKNNAGWVMMECRCGRSGFCINPAGEVYPCVGLPVSVGSLRKSSFKQIWDESDFIKKIRSTNLEDLPECSSCELLSFCARCKGMAYVEDSSLIAPSKEACRIANIVKEVVYSEKEKL